MAIFLKYGSLKGEANDDKHKDWIQLDSLQWQVSRNIAQGSSRGSSTREASAPMLSEVHVTKVFDAASPLLLKEAIGGPGTVAKIEITRTDNKGGHVAFQKYTLEGCLVSNYSVSTTGSDGRPMETMSLNFSKIESEYMKVDDKYAATTTGKVIYDIPTAKMG